MQRSSDLMERKKERRGKIREIVDDSGTSLICMSTGRNDKICYARMFVKKWERSII
jgi:hypothetical protein